MLAYPFIIMNLQEQPQEALDVRGLSAKLEHLVIHFLHTYAFIPCCL
jgi:hypothetical protein